MPRIRLKLNGISSSSASSRPLAPSPSSGTFPKNLSNGTQRAVPYVLSFSRSCPSLLYS